MKLEVIKAIEARQSNCSFAEKFGCGRMINNIIQYKKTIMRSLRDGAGADMKYLVLPKMPNPNTDKHVWEFCEVRGKNIQVNGSMLKTEALKASLKFSKDDFMASNGWLDAFVSWHKIKNGQFIWQEHRHLPGGTEQWNHHLPSTIHLVLGRPMA